VSPSTLLRAALLLVALVATALALAPAKADDTHRVEIRQVEDMKSIFGQVRSRKIIAARSRIGGTITTLSVSEGETVSAGTVIAIVGDPKLPLQIASLEARIDAGLSTVKNAELAHGRGKKLFDKGIIAKSRLDQLATSLEIARKTHASLAAERAIIEQRQKEGQVLAPAAGRILQVPVTPGAVVAPGEAMATVAVDDFILRLELPERHARFVKAGDEILLGARGLADNAPRRMGQITQVYPELKNGRVIADAEVNGLGNYFVGERALVWIASGKRPIITIPDNYLVRRYGMDFVHLAQADRPPLQVVVQRGEQLAKSPQLIEILSGLKAGDQIIKPAAQ